MRLISRILNAKISLKPALFYVGFILLSVSVMLRRSDIFNLPDFVVSLIFPVIASIFFALKFFLDKHSKKEFILSIAVMIAVILLKIVTGLNTYILASVLAFLAMREVDIRKVLKIDIAIKAFFLLSHALVFTVDYMLGVEGAFDYVNYFKKGVSLSLYFANPNTTGLLGTWIGLDILYLKKDKKLKDFIFPTIIVLTTFLLTASRTPFVVYILYLLLQFVRNEKVLTVIQRLTYPVLFALSFIMVNFIKPGSGIYGILNNSTSGRVGYSISAYKTAGINLLPSVARAKLLESYIVDVFYVKCMVDFGLVTLALYYIPNLLLPKDVDNETKRMSIITCVYLFFEVAVAYVGFATPYLIMANAIFNKDKMVEKETA